MRKVIAAVVLVLMSATVHAVQGQALGIKMGATLSNLDITPEPSGTTLNTLVSYGGGPFIHLGHGIVGLQIELLALTKGSKLEEVGSDTTKLKINYAELPLTFIVKAKQGPYVFAGPALALEISCQTQVRTSAVRVTSDCDGINAPIFERNKIDYGIVAGAGIHHTWGRRTFFLEGRYTAGMRDIRKDDTQEIKNKAVNVFLGLMSRVPARH